MRNDLISCFEDGFMHQFPTVKLRRLPFGETCESIIQRKHFLCLSHAKRQENQHGSMLIVQHVVSWRMHKC